MEIGDLGSPGQMCTSQSLNPEAARTLLRVVASQTGLGPQAAGATVKAEKSRVQRATTVSSPDVMLGFAPRSSAPGLGLQLSHYPFILFCFILFYFFFLGPCLWHMEVLSLWVKLELQLPVYATATAPAITGLCHICDLMPQLVAMPRLDH